MNHPVREVLKEVIFGLLIMEPHKVRERRSRRRRGRTTTSYRILGGNRFFRCHEKETKPREREREREREKEREEKQRDTAGE